MHKETSNHTTLVVSTLSRIRSKHFLNINTTKDVTSKVLQILSSVELVVRDDDPNFLLREPEIDILACIAWFEQCTIGTVNGGPITANGRDSNTDPSWYVFNKCTVSSHNHKKHKQSISILRNPPDRCRSWAQCRRW